MPIYKSKKEIVAIGFTHDPKQDYGKKYKMKKNIDPDADESDVIYAKVDLENNKISNYKDEPKYTKFRIANVDRPAINKIKKGTYK